MIVDSLLLAMLYLRSRPDNRRSAVGYLEEVFGAVGQATVAAAGSVLFAFFWRPGRGPNRLAYSRVSVLVAWGICIVLLAGFRIVTTAILSLLRQRGHNVINVVVVGDSPSARSFIAAIDSHPETGYRLVATIHESVRGEELRITLSELDQHGSLSEIILAQHHLASEDMSGLLSTKALRHVKIRALPELFGLPPAKVQVMPVVGEFPLLSLLGDPTPGVHRHVKRAIDLLGAVFLLIVLSPLLAVATIGIRLSSPGPILFRQERVGMDGRLFTMLKFRTMFQEANSQLHEAYVTAMLTDKPVNIDGGLYKLGKDPRVTKFGRFLRRFSIDELPQLFNVLRGEMSLVGPRPALLYEVELYEKWQRRRLDFRPGITGLWQVSGRSRLTIQDMLRLDVSYVETWTPLRDIAIILRTVPALLRSEAR